MRLMAVAPAGAGVGFAGLPLEAAAVEGLGAVAILAVCALAPPETLLLVVLCGSSGEDALEEVVVSWRAALAEALPCAVDLVVLVSKRSWTDSSVMAP